ncbi:MAG: DUF4340 domain-containing protein [Pseudomonadales bacterium]|nr:DUF4340 domain-containing protein [Pseudomonadales bacterium]
MNRKNLGLLVVAILGMAMIAFISQPGREEASSDAKLGKPLFEGLKASLSTVERVKVASSKYTTTISQLDGVWVIEEKDNYPADFGKFSEFLGKLADAVYVERKTARPENFGPLGVASLDDPNSTATQVSIETSDEQRDVLLGTASAGRGGTFARKPDEEQAWLVTSLGEIQSDPAKWIAPVILSVESEQVRKIVDTDRDGKQLVVSRKAEGDPLTVENLPAGAELKYGTVADGLARALVNLRATDVRGRTLEPMKNAITSVYELFDGSKVTLTAVADHDEHWLRVDVTPGEEGETRATSIDTAKTDRFEFQIEGYAYEQLHKTMADMIKPAEAPKADKKSG